MRELVRGVCVAGDRRARREFFLFFLDVDVVIVIFISAYVCYFFLFYSFLFYEKQICR